jgi:hypothetical protein
MTYNKILAVLAAIHVFPPRVAVCNTTVCPPWKKKEHQIPKKKFVERLWLLTVAPVGSQSKDITEAKFEIH